MPGPCFAHRRLCALAPFSLLAQPLLLFSGHKCDDNAVHAEDLFVTGELVSSRESSLTQGFLMSAFFIYGFAHKRASRWVFIVVGIIRAQDCQNIPSS